MKKSCMIEIEDYDTRVGGMGRFFGEVGSRRSIPAGSRADPDRE